MGLEIKLSTKSKKITEIRVTSKSNEVISIGIDQLPDYLRSFVVKTFVTELQYKKNKDTKTNIEQLLLKRALEFELQPLIKRPLKNESIKNISKSSTDQLAKFISIVVVPGETMSKPAGGPSPKKKLSMRGGAIVIRGVTLFLAAGKGPKPCASDNRSGKGKGRKKMTDKDACKCSPKLMEATRKDTLLNRKEIEGLYKIYKKLITFTKTTSNKTTVKKNSTSSGIGKPASVSEGIDRTVFREVLHNTFDIVTENTLMDRIFCVWDKNNCGLITVENWFRGLSLFLKGSVADQIEYCFTVYDLNSDGYITKDEMFQLLRNCLIKRPQEEDPDESVKDLVDIVMRKIDKDKDGKVSLEDFQKTVEEEPLLIEAFGKCLPSEESKITFLTTLTS